MKASINPIGAAMRTMAAATPAVSNTNMKIIFTAGGIDIFTIEARNVDGPAGAILSDFAGLRTIVDGSVKATYPSAGWTNGMLSDVATDTPTNRALTAALLSYAAIKLTEV